MIEIVAAREENRLGLKMWVVQVRLTAPGKCCSPVKPIKLEYLDAHLLPWQSLAEISISCVWLCVFLCVHSSLSLSFSSALFFPCSYSIQPYTLQPPSLPVSPLSQISCPLIRGPVLTCTRLIYGALIAELCREDCVPLLGDEKGSVETESSETQGCREVDVIFVQINNRLTCSFFFLCLCKTLLASLFHLWTTVDQSLYFCSVWPLRESFLTWALS